MGRRSSTPFRCFRLLPLNLITLNKVNIKLMIFGTGSLPFCILAVALEEALLGELVVESHSLAERGQLGGEILELVTHLWDDMERTQWECWWHSISKGASYVNWPITYKGRQSLVVTHVEILRLSAGGSWNSKTIGIKRNHKIHYIKHIKLCFYL